ncbi:MAG: glycosyl transferase, partial [Flavobacterium sp.]
MRKSRIKKIAFLLLKIVAVLLIIGTICFFAFRNMMLEKAIAKVAAKMERDYNSRFTVKQATFKGFSGIELK